MPTSFDSQNQVVEVIVKIHEHVKLHQNLTSFQAKDNCFIQKL